MAWIREYGIETVTRATVDVITPDGVVLAGGDGERRIIPADSVIVGAPRRSVQELAGLLEFSADELYVVGDAVRPRSAHNAVRDGFLIGVRI